MVGTKPARNGYIEAFLNLGSIDMALLAIILTIGHGTVITGLHRSPSTGSLMLAFFGIGIVYNCTEAALFRIMAPLAFLLAITRVRTFTRPRSSRSAGDRPSG